MEDNSFNFGLFVWMAEAARTSKRIKVSYEVRAKSGQFDDVPYGYDLEDGKLYISKNGSAEVVHEFIKNILQVRVLTRLGAHCLMRVFLLLFKKRDTKMQMYFGMALQYVKSLNVKSIQAV